jgi:hypothetical protein
MVFSPLEKPPSPSAVDEEEMRSGRRCMPTVVAALPRGSTSAGIDAPAPVPMECEPSILVWPPLQTSFAVDGAWMRSARAAHMVVVSRSNHGRVGIVGAWEVLDFFGDRAKKSKY